MSNEGETSRTSERHAVDTGNETKRLNSVTHHSRRMKFIVYVTKKYRTRRAKFTTKTADITEKTSCQEEAAMRAST